MPWTLVPLLAVLAIAAAVLSRGAHALARAARDLDAARASLADTALVARDLAAAAGPSTPVRTPLPASNGARTRR